MSCNFMHSWQTELPAARAAAAALLLDAVPARGESPLQRSVYVVAGNTPEDAEDEEFERELREKFGDDGDEAEDDDDIFRTDDDVDIDADEDEEEDAELPEDEE